MRCARETFAAILKNSDVPSAQTGTSQCWQVNRWHRANGKGYRVGRPASPTGVSLQARAQRSVKLKQEEVSVPVPQRVSAGQNACPGPRY